MDRRLFLTGLLGIAGAAAVGAAVRPETAEAGVVDASGILDEIDAPVAGEIEDGEVEGEVENVYHRRWHRPRRRPYGWRRRHYRRHYRRQRRRRVWRRVCRRYWNGYRWRRSCRPRRVWIWYWDL